jgi:hypothetical protein
MPLYLRRFLRVLSSRVHGEKIVESVSGSPISPPCLLVNRLGSAECVLHWITLRIPRQSSGVVYVLPQLITSKCFPAASAGPPTSGQRQAGILRDTSR